MTEEQWLSCSDPQAMLEWLHQQGNLTDRKARLFAVACCRRIWSLLSDERSRRAVEVADRFADGLVTLEEMRIVAMPTGVAALQNDAARAAAYCTIVKDTDAYDFSDVPGHAARAVVAAVVDAVTCRLGGYGEAIATRASERAAVAALLRDIFCPFASAEVNPSPWRTPTVLAHARRAYDDRLLPEGHLDPAGLRVLADALEEAGCHDPELLGHLRAVRPHYRGCWAVDAVLAR
jgi:hypothetical protein